MHFVILADPTPAPSTGSGGSGGSNYTSLIFIVLLVAVFYFLLLRPMKKRQQAAQSAAQQMRSNVGPGDQIVTIGGLHGTVVSTDDDSVVLEIAPGVEARYDRSSVARVLTPKVEEPEDTTDDDPDDDAADADDPAHTIIERND